MYIKKQSKISKSQSIKMDHYYCIYVPRMSKSMTEELVRNEMYKTNIGRVSRVDFIPIGFKPGFDEFHDPLFKSAFIHFDYLFNNENMYHILSKLDSGDQYKYMAECSQEYWYMWKAHKPIQETMLNNHQIMESGRWLQREMEKQSNLQLTQMEQMAKLIEKQAKKIDEQEERIIGLEESVKNMLTFGNCTNVFDEEFSPIKLGRDENDEICSVSTHRSMPELIENSDTDDDDDDSDSREKRIKNSAELCGNN